MLGCDATFFFFNVQILLFKKIYYILFVTPSFFPFGFFNPFFIYLVHTSFFPFHSLTACFFLFFFNFFYCRIEIEETTVSGSFNMFFLGHNIALAYRNHTNILMRYFGSRKLSLV